MIFLLQQEIPNYTEYAPNKHYDLELLKGM